MNGSYGKLISSIDLDFAGFLGRRASTFGAIEASEEEGKD
jgi:hypothetical protein